MTNDVILERFRSLRVWRRAGERAPHKPLPVLLALGRLLRYEEKVTPYAERDAPLETLLREFGPARRSIHPELPFWHLRSDGVWEVQGDGPMHVREGTSNPPRGELLQRGARGGFTHEVASALMADRRLAFDVAHALLDAHFPQSLHPDILEAVGLEDLTEAPALVSRRIRDPRFRERVLTAYEYRCAICGFDVRMGGVQLGLDAAHIKWHQAGGPDTETNGLALCVLHHKLFDRGALTISHEHRVVLSERVYGGVGFEEQVLRYHLRALGRVQSADYRPSDEFVEWHQREVFQKPARPGLTPTA
jgi:putative restriction endonuclease